MISLNLDFKFIQAKLLQHNFLFHGNTTLVMEKKNEHLSSRKHPPLSQMSVTEFREINSNISGGKLPLGERRMGMKKKL